MSVFHYFKQIARRKCLAGERPGINRTRDLKSYKQIQRVALLVVIHEKEDWDALQQARSRFLESGKQLHCVVYVPGKPLPDEPTAPKGTQLLHDGDLNWYGKPNKISFQEFTKDAFDLLVVMNPASSFCLDYLVAMSPAHLKVGPVVPGMQDELDLLVKIKPPFQLQELIDQSIHYISLLNP